MGRKTQTTKEETRPNAERRALLGVAGLVVPPTMAALLSTSMNSPAIAASGALLSRGGGEGGRFGSAAPLIAVPAAGAAATAAEGAPAAAAFTAAQAGPVTRESFAEAGDTPSGIAGSPVVASGAPLLSGPITRSGAAGAGLPPLAGAPLAGGGLGLPAGVAGPAGSTVYPAAASVRRIPIAKAGERG